MRGVKGDEREREEGEKEQRATHAWPVGGALARAAEGH
jgi:hypothetical protein